MHEIGVLVAVVSVAFAFRSLAVWLNRDWFRQGFAGDSSVHYCMIRQFKSKVGSCRVDEFLIPNTMSYPIIFHRICSLLPLKTIVRHSWLPNWLLFIGASAAFAVYVYYLTTDIIQTGGMNMVYFVSGIFFLTTSNLVFHGSAIAYLKLSERLFARTSTAFYFFTLNIYLLYGDAFSMWISVICCALALAASVFAIQFVFFTAPILSLCFWSGAPILIIMGGFVLSILFTGGHSWTTIKHMVRYWSIYDRFVKNSSQQAAALSRWLGPISVFRAIWRRDYAWLRREILSAEPVRTFIFYPEILLLMVLLAGAPSTLVTPIILSILPVFIVYFLTTTRAFNHLGESYRYFEYGLYLYIPFVIGQLLFQLNNGHFVKIVLGVYICWVLFFVIMVQLNRKSYPATDQLNKFLEELDLKSDHVVYPVTMRLGADICARTGCETFWWQPGGITCPDQYTKFIEEYPYLKREWKPLAKEFGVTHIICEKSAIEAINWGYDFSSVKTITEDERYVAYTVEAGRL